MKKSKIYIAGTGLQGDGYPNARNTIRILKDKLGLTVVEKSYWLPSNFHLWRAFKGSKTSSFLNIIKLFSKNLCSLIKVILTCPKNAVIYIPYPAIFFLFLYSFLPRNGNRKLIADSYISIWDAMYADRNRDKIGSPISRILKYIEDRAFGYADIVLTDTSANSNYYRKIYPRAREILSLPLASNPIEVYPVSQKISPPVRVLFVGTLIPLHGVDIILEAAEILSKTHPTIHFYLVGDGQMASLIENLPEELKNNITWEKNWLSTQELVTYVQSSDICLGVFSNNNKSSRVLPYKIYLYLACGSTVITQKNYSLPQDCPRPPFFEIPGNNATSLANKIIELAENPAERFHARRCASQYFKDHLSDESISRRWAKILSN